MKKGTFSLDSVISDLFDELIEREDEDREEKAKEINKKLEDEGIDCKFYTF